MGTRDFLRPPQLADLLIALLVTDQIFDRQIHRFLLPCFQEAYWPILAISGASVSRPRKTY